jgi:predicted PurR-regulated permease PerM
MAIAERAFGFSLKSFGPIAVGLFLAILGVMIYRLIKHLGAGFAVSGSMAYVIIILFLTATMPGFFTWINQNIPLLNLGLVIGFIWSLYNLISNLFKHKGLSQKLSEKFKDVKAESSEDNSKLANSKSFQRSQIKPITKQAFKTSNQILNELAEILKSIEKYGHMPEARVEIKKQINVNQIALSPIGRSPIIAPRLFHDN